MIPDRQNQQTQWPWLASDTDLPQQPVQLPSIDFTGQAKRQHRLLNIEPSHRPEMVSRPAQAKLPELPTQPSQIRVWNIPQWSPPYLPPQKSRKN